MVSGPRVALCPRFSLRVLLSHLRLWSEGLGDVGPPDGCCVLRTPAVCAGPGLKQAVECCDRADRCFYFSRPESSEGAGGGVQVVRMWVWVLGFAPLCGLLSGWRGTCPGLPGLRSLSCPQPGGLCPPPSHPGGGGESRVPRPRGWERRSPAEKASTL